ncbi:transcription factor ORG2-like [Spinacia oleracea]|uniref:Transcription factor ORG2-like n=1 Tax=Spinacia oleracea TaxID=3562 RepID=A0A9R0JHR2_SPIOL|nr:transcription factor ORG2-like [Spinacia oleracea]
MCPFVPTLAFDYPIELGIDNEAIDNYLNLDAIFLHNYLLSQAEDDNNDHVNLKLKQSKSPQSTSSADQFGAAITTITAARKTNHNASERDRRKKINVLYSSLRDLLPATDQMRRLSIPATVARVLKYIPELEQEVKDLTHMKEKLLSEMTVLQGNAGEIIQEEKPKIDTTKENLSTFSISVNKLSDKDMVIQISTFERISICEVLLLLEEDGYLLVDVTSFQSFGGWTFYNIHLSMEGMNVINYEKLNEELLSLIQKPKLKLKQKQQLYIL